jgi:hypothetical protein
MWRCCSQIASDYMKFYINPLRLVSAPPPPPPPPVPAPPLVSQARALIATLLTLTRGVQGCPKIISFDKSSWHPIFEKSLIFFFTDALRPYIFATPFAKKCTPLFHQSLTRESFSRSLFRYSFSLFLNKCQLFMSKDFWNLPVNPVWRVPGFMKKGKADNEHSNPVLLPLVPEFTNICISHLQFLHFQKNFVRSRRDWEKKCRMGIRQYH